VTVQAGILRLLDALRHDWELSVILITHDLGVMSSIADQVSIFYAGRVVESGPRADVLTHPRHPYTRALLDALPHPESSHETPLLAIKGAPPSPQQIPAGCRYHPRCPYAIDVCATDDPPLVPVGSSRLLACHVDTFYE
jgi:oligopeptide/dipeptide ABC transporter ATP-binding protein